MGKLCTRILFMALFGVCLAGWFPLDYIRQAFDPQQQDMPEDMMLDEE